MRLRSSEELITFEMLLGINELYRNLSALKRRTEKRLDIREQESIIFTREAD